MTTKDTIRYIMAGIKAARSASGIKPGRNFADFFTDRLIIAATEPTVVAFFERLFAVLDCDVGFIGGDTLAGTMRAATSPAAPAMLAYIREYPRIIAMVSGLRDETDYSSALESIELQDPGEQGTAIAVPTYQTNIVADCLSPLAHGGDNKAGNATLFRRCQVISTTGAILSLPFYAGNAIRGQIRDLLAVHFLTSLGLSARRDKPAVNLWFFHALFAGGALDDGKATKAIQKQLGGAGAVRTEGLHRFRDMLPGLSVLGCALGNRIVPGRVQFGDWLPHCSEWTLGDRPAAELMEWTFLTRREDHEGHAEGEHHGMIANTECLRTGTRLSGGLDLSEHTSEIEAGAIARGLMLLQKRGYLGAENRRGLGKVEIVITNPIDVPPYDPTPYDDHLANNKDAILDYLVEVGAIDKQAELFTEQSTEEKTEDARNDVDF